MFERFSEQARQIVVVAQMRARELRHGHIGTEHLLLALASDGGEIPMQALSAAGVDEERVRAALLEIVGAGRARAGSFLSFTPRAKVALAAAEEESLRLGHHAVNSGHVLLAATADDAGMAVRILHHLNVSRDELRGALAERLARPEVHEVTRPVSGERDASGFTERASEHRGPPNHYLVIRVLSAAEAPQEVREIAEGSLDRREHGEFDNVAFIGEVRDADLTGPLAHPEWVVAVHGPSIRTGMIIRTAGSWGSAAHRTAFGGGRARTLMRVGTVDRVELSTFDSPVSRA